jgi:hypothetical protein
MQSQHYSLEIFEHYFVLTLMFSISSASSATISGDGGAMGDEVVDDEGYLGARRVQRRESQSIVGNIFSDNHRAIFHPPHKKRNFFQSRISLWRLSDFFFCIPNQKCQTILSLSTLECHYFSHFYLSIVSICICLCAHLQSTLRGVCRVAPSAPR